MSTQNCRQVLALSAPVQVVKRTGAAMKCTKMKHERAKLAIVLFFILKCATLWRSWVPCFGVESRFLLFKFMKLARTYYPMPCFSIKGPWNLFKSSTSEEKPESGHGRFEGVAEISLGDSYQWTGWGKSSTPAMTSPQIVRLLIRVLGKTIHEWYSVGVLKPLTLFLKSE